MNDHLNITLLEMLERARSLNSKIDITKTDNLYYPLAQRCQQEIDNVIERLNQLVVLPQYNLKENQLRKLIELQKIVKFLDYLENSHIASLQRLHDDDINLTKLINKICKEINYPLIPPVASRLSHQYYCIDPEFNIIKVPLLESDFLLHLPDLYHELCHALLYKQNNPRVTLFQNRFSELLLFAKDNNLRMSRHYRQNNGESFAKQIEIFDDSWFYWAEEFFCDLFATCTIGVSYAWANLHLCIKRCQNPYYVPLYEFSTHPADHARMTVILKMLHLLNFKNEANEIEIIWNKFLSISKNVLDANYKLAYPDIVLENCVCLALDGINEMQCLTASNNSSGEIFSLLNQAWIEFRKQPSNYFKWERDQKKALKI